MMGTEVHQQYTVFYTRLTCIHVEPAPLTPSTASPLLCETHPAQRSSISGDRGRVRGVWPIYSHQNRKFSDNRLVYKQK